MKLKITPEIFTKFKNLHVGIVIAKDIDNKGSDDKIYHLLEEVEEMIRLGFTSNDLANHPLISPWRSAYSEFGAKPSKYHSSVEALMKRVLKGDNIPKISKVVDVYNYLSMKHLVPVGADDLDKVEGDISLMLAKGTEVFVPLGSDDVETPKEGEVIYKDSKSVLCRRWNWRECEKSKITSETKNLIIYVEGLPPVTLSKIKEVCEETVSLLIMFCGGSAEYHILSLSEPEVEVE